MAWFLTICKTLFITLRTLSNFCQKTSRDLIKLIWHNARMKDTFETYLKSKSDFYFQEKSTLNEAITYSLLAPGKRIRPLLALGFAKGFGADLEKAMVCGVAVEMIHTYSLIHDDLPAMDNDDFRRGRPTNHKVFGEATAILAGDSLLNLAPEFLIVELHRLQMPPENVLELTGLFLRASGHEGMIKGQSLDMSFETQDPSQFSKLELDRILKNIHKLKTGSIITWSCLAGLYSHNDSTLIRKYKCLTESIGQRIGLLFQIVDDVQDVTSSLEKLGKTPGKDEKAGKLTYTNLHGLEGARAMAFELTQDIAQDLSDLEKSGGEWNLVNEILESIKVKL